MILISWFKEIKSGDLSQDKCFSPAIPENLTKWLLELLACLDPALPTKQSPLPYCELSRTYAKMRNEATQLLRTVESSGKFIDTLSTMKVDVESLSTDDAINFASRLPTFSDDGSINESVAKHILDDIESARQRLLTTSGYLKCVQASLRCN